MMPTGYPDYTLELAGTVQVANGGTGLTTWPANAIPLGNGNQPMGYVEPWTSGVPVQANPAGGFSCGYVNNAGYPMALSADTSGVTLNLQGNSPSSAYIPCIAFYDWGNSATLAKILAALAAGQGVSNSQVNDFIIQSLAARVVLAQGSAGPQVILDSGGVQLPRIESVNGLTTIGEGVAVPMVYVHGEAASATGSLTALLASAPGGTYRASASIAINVLGTRTAALMAIQWTDTTGTLVAAYPANLAYAGTAMAAGVAAGGSVLMNVKAGTNISYQFQVGGGAGGSFDWVVVLERLG
jgi:hypothetical protein